MKSNSTISKNEGTIYLTVSYNHINIRIEDSSGNLLIDRSCIGLIESVSAATQAEIVQRIIEPVKELGISKVCVIVKGSGCAREAILSAIRDAGLETTSIKDVTPLPHNGCRPPKRKCY